ncbi:hypothetical protein ACFQE1_03530 [Halobium palmae]|uniref:Uncharacterized protein n=1 Tax=Halobium palmae TaxID=1776492 RepID=A0ABD5RVM0_9EURY
MNDDEESESDEKKGHAALGKARVLSTSSEDPRGQSEEESEDESED